MDKRVDNWKAKTLAHWDAINGLAVRRFGDSAMAEEAALAVIEELEADDWKRLRAFSGNASLATYIKIVTSRLLEDFARKRYGRLRPPLWIKTLGGIWAKLFELLCLRRLSVVEAVEIAAQQREEKLEELEDAACHLLEKIPQCGKHQALEVVYDQKTDQRCADKDSAGSFIEMKQKKELFAAIFAIVMGTEIKAIDTSLASRFDQLQIVLKSEEKLLLKLCYQEDMSVAKAAKLLGMTRFQAHGKIRRLLNRLGQELDRVGLAQELKLYL